MSIPPALGLLANAYGIGPYDFDYRLRSVKTSPTGPTDPSIGLMLR